jgi:hypothetical protein
MMLTRRLRGLGRKIHFEFEMNIYCWNREHSESVSKIKEFLTRSVSCGIHQSYLSWIHDASSKYKIMSQVYVPSACLKVEYPQESRSEPLISTPLIFIPAPLVLNESLGGSNISLWEPINGRSIKRNILRSRAPNQSTFTMTVHDVRMTITSSVSSFPKIQKG